MQFTSEFWWTELSFFLSFFCGLLVLSLYLIILMESQREKPIISIIYRLIGMNKRRRKRNYFAKMCQLLKLNDTYRHTYIDFFLIAHELPMLHRILSFILLIKTNISTYLTFTSDANIYLHLRSFRFRNTLCIISTDRSQEYVHIN